VNTFPLFGHPPARSVRWWMLDVLVTVLAALFSLPDLAQEHVTLTLAPRDGVGPVPLAPAGLTTR
jgi:hypothetical protein